MFEETKENGDGTSTITQTWKCTECSTITHVTTYEYDSNGKLVTNTTQDYSGSGVLSSIYTENTPTLMISNSLYLKEMKI